LDELLRIYSAGGQVARSDNHDGSDFGPHRVWKKGENYPGLAMSRSIGDFGARDIGVINDPITG